MEPPGAPPLTVAITSRALFDLEHSHELYEREGVDAYQAHQRENEDDAARAGHRVPAGAQAARAERRARRTTRRASK